MPNIDETLFKSRNLVHVAPPNPLKILDTCLHNDSVYIFVQITCKITLYKSLPALIKSVAPTVIKTFLEKGGSEILTSANLQAKQEVLRGLQLALHVPDPPQSITSVLYQCLETLYRINITEVKVQGHSICFHIGFTKMQITSIIL